MRSLLFVPADSESKLKKALTSGADALIIDLEDSVALDQKARAREMAAHYVRGARQLTKRPYLIVRINGLTTAENITDLDVIGGALPDAVMLPKAQNGDDINLLDARLAVREAIHGHAEGEIRIFALVTETAASIFNMGSYQQASPRLKGLAWGGEDLSADVGSMTYRLSDGELTPPYQMVRSLALFAASAAQVQAIDCVYPDYKNETGFTLECARARRDGFTAKLAIHPSQVSIINDAFSPSPEEHRWAEAVVAAFAQNPQAGVLTLNGSMIDKPHLKRAQHILEYK